MFLVSGFRSLNPLEPPPADCTPRRPELKAFVSSPWSPTKVEPNQHKDMQRYSCTGRHLDPIPPMRIWGGFNTVESILIDMR